MIDLGIPKRLQSLQDKIIQQKRNGDLVIQNGDCGFASAPSNIALIKYWGKEKSALQMALNSSVSLTLGDFRSTTQITIRGQFFPEGEKFARPDCVVELNKNTVEKASEKLFRFWERISQGWGDELGFYLQSQNNFPTACGIASSASGYAAFVGAVADVLQLSAKWAQEDLQYWLCEWARIGSGSATRSALIEPHMFCAWHCSDGVSETKKVEEHNVFSNYMSIVAVVSDSEKSVSSSAGHLRVDSSMLQQIRLANIKFDFEKTLRAIESGDFEVLRDLTEKDAFAMHAVMQSGEPSLKYILPETANIISKFIEWRNTQRIKAFWTLDAGPNVHIVFAKEDEGKVQSFFGNAVPQMLGRTISLLTNTSHLGLQIGRGLCKGFLK